MQNENRTSLRRLPRMGRPLGLLAAAAMLLGGVRSQAEPVTFAFTAKIKRINPGYISSLVTVGDTVSGTYTFDSEAPNLRPPGTSNAYAIDEGTVDAGGTPLAAQPRGNTQIVLSRQNNVYIFHIDLEQNLHLECQIRHKKLASNALLLNPPDLSDPGIFSLEFKITGNGGIFGHITSLSLVERDTTAPAVSCSVAQNLLWPRNHQVENVGFSASAQDDRDPNPVVQVFVYSNEPDNGFGDGNTTGDAALGADGSLCLRAERAGGNHGRVYLIVATATDAAGNVGFDCCTVLVPHDRSSKSVKTTAAEAAIAETYCVEYGEALPSYHLIPTVR